MAKYKSKWGPTGVVMLPSGKVSYNGLVEAQNKKDEEFLEANTNFVKATKADEEAAAGDDDEDKEVDLNKLNKEDLIAHAKEKGVEVDENATKAEIIKVIEG